MKKVLSIVIILVIILGIFYFITGKEAVAPVVTNSLEQANVENYLRENIVKLSPIPAVLGGTWYVISDTIDFEKNSGTVVYEDGHIQETRSFSYTLDEKGEVTSLTIK